MKLNKFLSITLLAGALMLSACGSKGNGGDSTPAEPVYTVTAGEYELIKSNFNNYGILVNSNFTMTVQFQNVSNEYKFADGKIDGFIEGDHCVLDIDKSTFNATTSESTYDEYYYDIDDGKWYKTTLTGNLSGYYNLFFEYFEVMPDEFEDLTYNEEKHSYLGTKTIEDEMFSTELMFKDGTLVSISFNKMLYYTFSEFGTTTVTLPTDFIIDD